MSDLHLSLLKLLHQPYYATIVNNTRTGDENDNYQYLLPTTDCPARLKDKLVGLFLLKLCLSLR